MHFILVFVFCFIPHTALAQQLKPIRFQELTSLRAAHIELSKGATDVYLQTDGPYELSAFGFARLRYETNDSQLILAGSHPNLTAEAAIQWLQSSGLTTLHLKPQEDNPRHWVYEDEETKIKVKVVTRSERLKGPTSYLKVWLPISPSEALSGTFDSLITSSGKLIKADVLESTSTHIKYRFPGELVEQEINKHLLNAILYRSGRLESGKPLAIITGKSDYHRVTVTIDPRQVEGLRFVGEIKGVTGWSGVPTERLGESDAGRVAQKRAAQRKIPILLLVKTRPGLLTQVVVKAYRPE